MTPKNDESSSHLQFDAVALEYDFMAETFHSSELFLKHLPKGRQLALELGCGSGILASDLSVYFNKIIALDLSAELLQIAQVKRYSRNVVYCQMDVNQLGLASGFDYITSQNVFHHLNNIPIILEQLKQLLKPGGRLVLTDVISDRETPPTIVYVIGALKEYIPNLSKYGREVANRIFRFRVSRHWLSHLASDCYLSKETFHQLYTHYLPGSVFPQANCVVWDKP
ncbi:MAG: class I SAM-dependent methyltransferase [Chloroflexota bacterium]